MAIRCYICSTCIVIIAVPFHNLGPYKCQLFLGLAQIFPGIQHHTIFAIAFAILYSVGKDFLCILYKNTH